VIIISPVLHTFRSGKLYTVHEIFVPVIVSVIIIPVAVSFPVCAYPIVKRKVSPDICGATDHVITVDASISRYAWTYPVAFARCGTSKVNEGALCGMVGV